MTISLTPQESQEYFLTALCNTFGIDYYRGGGLELRWDPKDYESARKTLVGGEKGICREDVWMAILLEGGKLTIEDTEGDDGPWEIGISEVYERVQKTPTEHLLDMIKGDDDATTADVMIQTVFFEEVIFG
jgi:hypothetical protein